MLSSSLLHSPVPADVAKPDVAKSALEPLNAAESLELPDASEPCRFKVMVLHRAYALRNEALRSVHPGGRSCSPGFVSPRGRYLAKITSHVRTDTIVASTIAVVTSLELTATEV